MRSASPLVRIGLAVALGSSLPLAAFAKGKPELPAGGNTIAGPGRVTIEPGGQTLVLRQSDTTPFDLCVTVVHAGKPGTSLLGVVRDPGSVYNGSSVSQPGDAVTVCRAASNEVEISCTSAGPPCVGLWRVDKTN